LEFTSKCFARWREDNKKELFFRDQTILQFGDSWELIANFVLLNPGSSSPIKEQSENSYLQSKNLPYLKFTNSDNYFEFSIDPLMTSLIKLLREKYPSGGVLKLYNLFNLKNPKSASAIKEFKSHTTHPFIFTKTDEIEFKNKPVIIACGKAYKRNQLLKNELKKYIELTNQNKLYSISKVAHRSFKIGKAQTLKSDIVDSYHPSYSTKYGNNTVLSSTCFE